MYSTPPCYAAALRMVGETLHTMILENYRPWPGWPKSSTRTEMRASLADLRHLQGFLASVGREHDLSSSLDPEDAYLANIAACGLRAGGQGNSAGPAGKRRGGTLRRA